MRIGELAARTEVSVRSLRYYEEQGLLVSVRSPSGQRHYPEAAVERVAFIQRLYAAGLSSRTIAEVLPCAESPSEENSDAALARLAEERDRLSAHIDELVRTRETLDAITETARAYRDELLAREQAPGPREQAPACEQTPAGAPAPAREQAPARGDRQAVGV